VSFSIISPICLSAECETMNHTVHRGDEWILQAWVFPVLCGEEPEPASGISRKREPEFQPRCARLFRQELER
jgi:hypothetical protein